MSNIAVRKVKNLEKVVRQSMQQLLGRRLRAEEEVTVVVRQPREDRLDAILNRFADKAADMPEDELNALIDEALLTTRQHHRGTPDAGRA